MWRSPVDITTPSPETTKLLSEHTTGSPWSFLLKWTSWSILIQEKCRRWQRLSSVNSSLINNWEHFQQTEQNMNDKSYSFHCLKCIGLGLWQNVDFSHCNLSWQSVYIETFDTNTIAVQLFKYCAVGHLGPDLLQGCGRDKQIWKLILKLGVRSIVPVSSWRSKCKSIDLASAIWLIKSESDSNGWFCIFAKLDASVMKAKWEAEGRTDLLRSIK